MKKTLYSALLATAMIPMVAVAQTTPPAGGTAADPATPPATEAPAMGTMEPGMDTTAPAMGADTAGSSTAVEGPFVTVPPTGAWRVTDLNGKTVEDAAGENIGSISDVLVDENGEVIAVLVGVGGFLGIGTKDVAVAMDQLQFGPGSMDGLASAPAADAAPAGGGMAADPAAPAAGTADTATTQPVVGEDNLPDRIVLAVTREELEAAPAYGEPDSGSDTAGTMEPAAGGMAPAEPAGGMAPAGGTAPATAPQ